MSDLVYAEYIADGKADPMGCTDLETLYFAERLAMKKAMQYARRAFKAELIDGNYELAHLRFQRSENIVDDITHHIRRLIDRM